MTHHTEQFGVDGNGVPTELRVIDGREFCVHYDNIPDSDVTTIHGVRCTTALRTVIDIAPDISAADLERVVRDSLERRLFTVDEAMARVGRPDMTSRRGALLLRALLTR